MLMRGYIAGCMLGLVIMIIVQKINMAVVGCFLGSFTTLFVMALMFAAKEE